MWRGLLWLLLAARIEIAVAQKATPLTSTRFVGAQSCASSSCHGGAGEKRSQYLTWQREDFHTRGFAILSNARSERIAHAVGLADASTSPRCTSCHAPMQNVPAALRSEKVDPRAGVSCENCHGAAAAWLRGHTRPDWSYATRVGAGMRDLQNFYVRANTCVACHQNIDADLTAAGHPDLLFELDRQTIEQPMHWRDPAGSGPRAWLVGQAVALREASWKLARQPEGNEQTLAQWHGLAWLLAKVTQADRSLGDISAPLPGPAFAGVQQQADALARRAAQKNLDPAFVRRLRHFLAATGSEFASTADDSRELLFRRAQRLVLALAALEADEKRQSPLLDPLRQDVRNSTAFEPAQFARHLADLEKTLPKP